MYIEFAILGAAALVTLSAAVQHSNTFLMQGLGFIFSDRSIPMRPEGFAGRSERTLRNNIESSAMFVPPAILLVVLGQTNGLAAAAAIAYLAARIGFTLSYWLGINRLRSVLWGFGMAMICIVIATALLGVATPTLR